MPIHHLQTLTLRLPIFASSSARRRPTASCAAAQRHPTPARDRVITFGKHKGRMLGTLPSTYLSWISNNLRAGDTEEWARLADQVLSDPFYRDRLEWEAAQRVLSGDGLTGSRSGSGAVAELLSISSNFKWDNEDKEGWERVDFGLLGTSHGGRIPRRREEEREKVAEVKRGERRLRKVSERREFVNPFPGRGAILDKIKRREEE